MNKNELQKRAGIITEGDYSKPSMLSLLKEEDAQLTHKVQVVPQVKALTMNADDWQIPTTADDKQRATLADSFNKQVMLLVNQGKSAQDVQKEMLNAMKPYKQYLLADGKYPTIEILNYLLKYLY